MTSMLLTLRQGFPATPATGSGACRLGRAVDIDGSGRTSCSGGRCRERRGRTLGRSVFLAAIARRDLLLRRVFGCLFYGHLAGQRPVAGHERGHLLEAVAIPLLELDHPRALVVGAARLDRREETRGAELLDS